MLSIRTLLCSLVILFFVMYFFAILMVQGTTDHRYGSATELVLHEELLVRFGTLPAAMYTLFAAISTGISWNQAWVTLASLHGIYSTGMLVYIALVLFGVMNVVTSVFVESAIMSAQHDKELMVQEQQHRREVAIVHVKELFQQMDTDGSGEISADEMEHFLSEPTLNCYIDALGITAENTRTLFY